MQVLQYTVCTHAPCPWGRSDPSDCLIQRCGSSKGRGLGQHVRRMMKTALEALTGRLRRRLLILGSRLIAAVSSVGGQSQVEGSGGASKREGRRPSGMAEGQTRW